MKIGIFANDTPHTEQIKNQLEQKLNQLATILLPFKVVYLPLQTL